MEAGIEADELKLGGSGKKMAFFGGTAVIKSAVADLLAQVNVLNSPGLAIGTAKAKVLIANTTYYVVNGVLCAKATAEITLAGTTANTKFAVYQLTIQADGTVTVTKSVVPNAVYINATALSPTHTKLQSLLDALQSYSLV